MLGGRQVAVIKLDHAAVHGGLSPTIVGNFLISDGLHWDTLRVRLGGASLATVLEHFPASASAGDRGRAELASERIQNERSSGWDLKVLIRGDESGDKIVFSPISVRDTTVEVPFQFTSADGDTVRGALRLSTPTGLLEMAVIRRPDDGLLTRAWVFALGAFAGLTCAQDRVPRDSRSVRRRVGGQDRQTGRRAQPADRERAHHGRARWWSLRR
jgi:hypothetical protein